MRYNPSTDRALSTDEIATQCRTAIMKASTPVEAAVAAESLYDQILTFARWENDQLIAA